MILNVNPCLKFGVTIASRCYRKVITNTCLNFDLTIAPVTLMETGITN